MKKPFHSINSQLLGSMCLHEKDSQLLNGEISEMISKKGKRKIEYDDNIFYWYVRKNPEGNPRIHILSEDKRINLEFAPFDSEIPVTPKEIKAKLERYFDKNKI